MIGFIITIILFISSIYIYNSSYDVSIKNIQYVVIAIFALMQLQQIKTNKKEGFYIGNTNIEAITTIASMYNNGVLNIPKLNVMGNMAVSGKLDVSENISSSGSIIATNPSDKFTVAITGNKISLTNANDNSIQTLSNGWGGLNISLGDKPSRNGGYVSIGRIGLMGSEKESGNIIFEDNTINNTSKQQWMINNAGGVLRFYPTGTSTFVETKHLPSFGRINTSWYSSNGTPTGTQG